MKMRTAVKLCDHRSAMYISGGSSFAGRGIHNCVSLVRVPSGPGLGMGGGCPCSQVKGFFIFGKGGAPKPASGFASIIFNGFRLILYFSTYELLHSYI